MREMNAGPAAACRACGATLTKTLVDLGLSPLANSFVPPTRAQSPLPRYPLRVRVCDDCLLAQIEATVPPEELFDDYAYFSSYSDSWLAHCRKYADEMTSRFSLGPPHRVVEIASNDGYLLQYFVAKRIPVLGVDPAANVVDVARARGIRTELAFFGAATARRLRDSGYAADLLAANNVLAHVPDINDFVEGVNILLKPQGVFTVEFPHLMNLIRDCQFDTIYHEHYSYLSLLAVERVFANHGLRIFDVEEVPTHGGSLRVFACRQEASHALERGPAVVRQKEIDARLDRPAGYAGFQARVENVRDGLLSFLNDAKRRGKRVVGYGAAAKGNTLLNFAGVGPDLLELVADRSPVKQGMLLPGSLIPVAAPEAIDRVKPDFVLILPWNLKHEVMSQLTGVRTWGCRFVTAIPTLTLEP
ncbi:MAG: class I SAM-dependent methyltransferase [Arenicellales bacterium]